MTTLSERLALQRAMVLEPRPMALTPGLPKDEHLLRFFRLTSWSAACEQVLAAAGGVVVVHEDGSRRVTVGPVLVGDLEHSSPSGAARMLSSSLRSSVAGTLGMP